MPPLAASFIVPLSTSTRRVARAIAKPCRPKRAVPGDHISGNGRIPNDVALVDTAGPRTSEEQLVAGPDRLGVGWQFRGSGPLGPAAARSVGPGCPCRSRYASDRR